MRYLLSVLVFITCLTACQRPQDPTVLRVENVDVKRFDKKAVHLAADMVLHNPNAFALELAKADLKAIVDEVELATISQAYDTDMPANSDFKMPIELTMDLEKLYGDNPVAAIGKAMQIMADRKLDVRFVGTIKAGSDGFKLDVPVDQLEEVSF